MSQSIHEVIVTVFIAIVLVVLVVYIFLQSWRATIIPVVAIPVSLIGTFTILTILGGSVNNLSLFGLVLAVGIVVDDAIVVVENVERNMALGMSPREAAHETMTEVSTALIAIALTLCAVFVPVAFISGIPGLFFKQFAITIAGSTDHFVLRIAYSQPGALCNPPEASQRGMPALRADWTGPSAATHSSISSIRHLNGCRKIRRTDEPLRPSNRSHVCCLPRPYRVDRFPDVSDGHRLYPPAGHWVSCGRLPASSGIKLGRTDEVVRRVNEIALNTYGSKHTSTSHRT